MCGLVGAYGFLDRTSAEVFDDMLYMDVVRGKDSVGVCLVSTDANYDLYKSLGGPLQLYNKYEKEAALGRFSFNNRLLAMGHNRAATQGEVNEDNAHPFDIGRVVGAHNGTVNLWSLYNLKGYKENSVDSKILYTELDNSYNPQKLWDEAYGAMTLTWWDKTTSTFNIASNGERPLSYVIVDDVLYYASEEWMLIGALLRNKVKKFDNPKSFNVDSWYVISYNSELPLDKKVVVEERKLYPPEYNDYGVFYNNNNNKPKVIKAGKRVDFSIEAFNLYEGNSSYGWFDALTQENQYLRVYGIAVGDTKTSEIQEELKVGRCNRVFYTSSNCINSFGNGLVVNWHDVKEDTSVVWGEAVEIETTKGYAGAVLSRTEFEAIVENTGGCINCLGEIYWSERNKVYWVDGDNLSCPDCVDVVSDFYEPLVNRS